MILILSLLPFEKNSNSITGTNTQTFLCIKNFNLIKSYIIHGKNFEWLYHICLPKFKFRNKHTLKSKW